MNKVGERDYRVLEAHNLNRLIDLMQPLFEYTVDKTNVAFAVYRTRLPQLATLSPADAMFVLRCWVKLDRSERL
jgi:hypothetical protein